MVIEEDEVGAGPEPSIELTAEELVVLANALGLELPVPEPASLTGDRQVRAALVDLARRSLVARRVLWTDGLVFTVVGPVQRMLEILAEPALLVRLGHTRQLRDLGYRSRWEVDVDPVLVARPDGGVEVAPQPAGTLRLTPFHPDTVLRRVAAATALVDRPSAPDVRAFDVPPDALAAACRLVAAGQADAAAGALLAERAHEPSVRAFVAALAAGAVGRAAEVTHRPTPTVLAGGVCSWIDGGAAGLWTMPDDGAVEAGAVFAGPWSAPPPPRRLVTVAPATADALLDEMAGYLPAAPTP